MIRMYFEENNELKTLKFKNEDETFITYVQERMLVDITSPNEEIIQDIADKTKLPLDMLMLSLDEEEMAHVDFDDNANLVVIDIPYSDNQDKFFTIPFFICFNEKYIVTICKKKNEIIKNIIKQTKKFEPHKHTRTTLFILYKVATEYIKSLKEIDKRSKDVEQRLHTSMKNKELIELMEINKMLVYFSTSLNSNKAVTQKLIRSPLFRQYEANQDLMDDLIVENDQAIEMCNIYRDILAGTMDAFASIISNNLNVVMKTLAIITIVLSIPTIIASFYGMNVDKLPLADVPYSFWIIVGISLVAVIVAGLLFFFYGRRTKIDKERKPKRKKSL